MKKTHVKTFTFYHNLIGVRKWTIGISFSLYIKMSLLLFQLLHVYMFAFIIH